MDMEVSESDSESKPVEKKQWNRGLVAFLVFLGLAIIGGVVGLLTWNAWFSKSEGWGIVYSILLAALAEAIVGAALIAVGAVVYDPRGDVPGPPMSGNNAR